MSEDLSGGVESLYAELDKSNKRAIYIKKSINSLCALMDKPQPFAEVDLASSPSGHFNIYPDQFLGKGIATATKEYLKMRGPASTLQEIYDTLVSGGFEFPEEWGDKFKLRNLSISIRKNSKDFCYVKSSNSYGLWEFYPDKKRERNSNPKEEAEESSEVPIDLPIWSRILSGK
ncbi:MAG: hypothetical protein WAV76_00130 [Bacteroidota bacterium]